MTNEAPSSDSLTLDEIVLEVVEFHQLLTPILTDLRNGKEKIAEILTWDFSTLETPLDIQIIIMVSVGSCQRFGRGRYLAEAPLSAVKITHGGRTYQSTDLLMGGNHMFGFGRRHVTTGLVEAVRAIADQLRATA